MSSSRTFLTAAFVALASCANFAGCSVIGFGVGSVIDAATPAKKVYDSVNVTVFRPGQKVTITTSTGQFITGKCGGWVQATDRTYLLRYQRAVDERLVPPLESPVTVIISDTQRLEGTLLGFQVNTAQRGFRDRRPRPVDPWQVCLQANGVVAETCLTLQNVNAINIPGGRVFPSEALSTRLAAGSVPACSAIRLLRWSRTAPIGQGGEDWVLATGDSLLIPVGEVDRVTIRNPRNFKWIMGALGLVFDIVAIASFSIEFDWSGSDFGGGGL